MHHASRVWASLPPDAATYLFVVLENRHGFAEVLVWALNAWVGELFVLYTLALLAKCLWPLLPKGLQHTLLKVRRFFWPWAASRDQSQEIAELKERVRDLERCLGSPLAHHRDDPAGSTEIPDEKRTES